MHCLIDVLRLAEAGIEPLVGCGSRKFDPIGFAWGESGGFCEVAQVCISGGMAVRSDLIEAGLNEAAKG